MFVASYRNTEAGVRTKRTPPPPKIDHDQAAIERLRVVVEVKERQAEELQKLLERKALAEAAVDEVHEEIERSTVRMRLKRHTFREIEERAMKLFKVRRIELVSARRHRKIVFARQFIYYWAYRLTLLSYPAIGRLLGGRDHTTVICGARVYRERRLYMGRNLREPRQ